MKKVEREGKVFVDWSQNHQQQDDDRRLLAAGPRAPDRLDPAHLGGGRARRRRAATAAKLVFETADVLERIEKQGDLFAPVLELKQKLPELGELEAS